MPTDADESIEESFKPQSSPVWILGVALLADVLGFTAVIFAGQQGAVAGYLLACLGFTTILIFRRQNGKLTETTYVAPLPGLNQGLRLLTGLTVALILFSTWPIATEISRG